jgi:monoamine oxidase
LLSNKKKDQPVERTEVLIVGGGLAGLALAETLHRDGHSFVLLEARSRLGGRIKTAQQDGASFDMGPAWFWPGQPRMEAMVRRFGLRQFDQFSAGDLMFEDERGQVQRGRGYASLQGSFRLDGGLGALIDVLTGVLPAEALRLEHEVQTLRHEGGQVIAEIASGGAIAANQVVLAVPPRIAAGFAFAPTLPITAGEAMTKVPTWMAGQAKAVAVYETPFWRDEGLSGDAMSRFGPMVEIHDASPSDTSLGALFGFIGVPPTARFDERALRRHILAQLERLFGALAATPKELFVKDWAFDPFTATAEDLSPMRVHPAYGMPSALDELWQGRLIFGGTEVAREFGGYLEGALEAAELAFQALNAAKRVA